MSGQRTVYEGRCRGGPMQSQLGQSRFPKGFLLVDRARNMATVYDWNGEEFVAREPEELNEEGRLRAGLELTYDVRVVDE